MKHTKILLFGILIMVSMNVNAQTYWNGTPGTVETTTTGDCNVGGIISGSSDCNISGDISNGGFNKVGGTLFELAGLIDMSPKTGDANWRSIWANSNYRGLSIFSKTASTDGSSIELYAPTSTFPEPTRAGSIFYTSHDNGDKFSQHVFLNYDGKFHTNLTINNDGRTLIGHDIDPLSTYSADVLTVHTQMGFYNPYDDSWRAIHGNTDQSGLSISSKTSSADGSSIELYGGGSTFPDIARQGRISYYAYGTSTFGHVFYNYAPSTSTYTSLMAITNNGQVVIGNDLINNPTTEIPTGYFLYVQKGILTEKLKVANSTDGANWSDFVFNKDYKLMPLNEIEKYVAKNKHLPEIPSASDVARDGIDVTNMEAKLLQKVEELTLYVIQQQKEIDALKKRVNTKQ